MIKRLVYTFLILTFAVIQVDAQVFTDKVVGKKNQDLIDSLKIAEYPYSLPIWGAKAAAKGYKLPLPAGLNINYMTQKSDLVIENLMVGFNNGPQYDLDEIIRFNNSISRASSVNLRPDIWILPFLNVYAIFSRAKTSTEINAGVWIPADENNWTEVTTFSTTANFDATAAGFGVTPTIGVGGGFLALDMNVVWTDVSALDKPVRSFVFGPRMGKNINLKKPDTSVSFWVGAFRLSLSSMTNGSMYLDELMPTDELQGKVDNGIQKVGDAQEQVDSWWDGLSDSQQNNPINEAKYENANRVLDKTATLLTSMDAALSDGDRATVQYSLEKRPKDMWNFVVGSQYQFSRHFMIRGEYGFLGSRQQFIGGLQYRFGF